MTATIACIETKYENFWDEVPAEPVPAMVTYGQDDINIGWFVYVHYTEPSREQLEKYWEVDPTHNLSIRMGRGSGRNLPELLAQNWAGVPMLYFGCSCCIHDVYEFNLCGMCEHELPGRHFTGCPKSFHRDSVEGMQARDDWDTGCEVGREGRRCTPKMSPAFRLGYRFGRNHQWKTRYGYRKLVVERMNRQ